VFPLDLIREESFLPSPGFVLDLVVAAEARHEQESSLPPRERECGEMCAGMGECVEELD
jgi:hypothetical protein